MKWGRKMEGVGNKLEVIEKNRSSGPANGDGRSRKEVFQKASLRKVYLSLKRCSPTCL